MAGNEAGNPAVRASGRLSGPSSVQAHGKVTIDVEECKGCGLCVESCPPKCLELGPELNAYGAHPAHYAGQDCTGCGICFYCCPEPGAITVYRVKAKAKTKTAKASTQEVEHASAL